MSDDWQGFRLMPDDVLFFRDGKPNSRGSDHYLRSLFPPNPSTLYGALRARRLLDEGVSLASLDEDVWRRLPADLRGELGDWGHFGSLEIRGPWPIRGDEPLLPAPSDLGLTFRERRPDERPSGRRRRGGLEPPRPPAIDQVARFRLPPDSGTGGGHSHDCKLLLPYLYNGSGW